MRAAVVIPTQDALRRDLEALDKAIAAASARAAGAWELARRAEARLLAVLEDAEGDRNGQLLGVQWREPSWASTSAYVFASRGSAVRACTRALEELRGFMRNGGIPAFQSVSMVLVDAFGVERPEGLDWRPDAVILNAEREAVAAELARLYGPRPAPDTELPMAASA